jgi:organic hydroperoxide reductase OsmC/OhrA
MTTFEGIAAQACLDVRGYRSRAEGVLSRTATGLDFTSFHVGIELEVDQVDVERAKVLMEKARKRCLVSRALRPPLTVDAAVMPAAAVAAI